ncbi:hypothetical protein ACFL27_09310 [candidate division CSSED10-310 bacterium]|uniref:Uncharacterized protein n=1 Tax=candidate division CSSED10-310 bacterium TaxID=2855610 RepID=A0ABV6YVZ5_UNCC1
MGRQSIKILIGLLIFAFLLGAGVLVYSHFSKSLDYSIATNIESNRDYYPDLTKELAKKEKKTDPEEKDNDR